MLKEYIARGKGFYVKAHRAGKIKSGRGKRVMDAINHVDVRLVTDYFRKHGVVFDPDKPDSVPVREVKGKKHFMDGLIQQWREWENFDAFDENGDFQGKFFPLDRKSDFHVRVFEMMEEYEKFSPKPAICRAILEGMIIKHGYRLRPILRTAELLRKAENSPRYAKVHEELRFLRELFEERMLDAVKIGVYSDHPWMNLWHNATPVLVTIHAKLIAAGRKPKRR